MNLVKCETLMYVRDKELQLWVDNAWRQVYFVVTIGYIHDNGIILHLIYIQFFMVCFSTWEAVGFVACYFFCQYRSFTLTNTTFNLFIGTTALVGLVGLVGGLFFFFETKFTLRSLIRLWFCCYILVQHIVESYGSWLFCFIN